MADLLQDLTKKSEIGDAVWTSNNKMLFNILITCIFVAEIQFSTLLGLKKFQVFCYCNTSCVLQSAKGVIQKTKTGKIASKKYNTLGHPPPEEKEEKDEEEK